MGRIGNLLLTIGITRRVRVNTFQLYIIHIYSMHTWIYLKIFLI